MRRLGHGPPVTLNEIAELRFFAESDEERDLPLEELARVIMIRESRRMGVISPQDFLPAISRN